MGDYAKAEPRFSQAIEIWKVALGEKHPTYATSLNNLAGLHYKMGDYAKAESLFYKVLEIRKIALGEKHPDYAMSLNNLAYTYTAMRDFAKGEPLYLQALEIKKVTLGEKHPGCATSLYTLAHMYDAMGDYVKAGPLYEQCLSITRKNLDDAAYVLSERQQLAMNQGARSRLDSYLRSCLASPSVPLQAVENVLLWKGNVLVRLRGIRVGMSDPTISKQFAELQRVASQLSGLAQAIPVPKDLERWKSRIAKLTTDKEVLESLLMKESDAFRQAVEHVSFDQIRQAIPTGAVLVDYLDFAGKDGRTVLASIVQREGEPVVISLGSASEASKAIDTWRESFGMSAQAKAAGLQLRQQLWEPVLKQIGSVQTILVSTDGVLGRLPFAALPGREPGRYLIEDHRLAFIPVPQMLPAMVSDVDQKDTLLSMMLMGDVDYDASLDANFKTDEKLLASREVKTPMARSWDRSEIPIAVRGSVRWGSLRETRTEVDFIAALYKHSYPSQSESILDLRQSEATESAFRKYAPECAVLHLATHGFFSAPEHKSALSPETTAERGKDRDAMFGNEREVVRGFSPGQLSGIVFAGANIPQQAMDPLRDREQPDDGIMTADEIAFQRLEGVRLVVLSACETGLGEVAGGEGLLGIQRGFQVAGARRTIATLWKVDDRATRKMMEKFYTNLLVNKLSTLDSLRETQLWALNNPKEVFSGDTQRGIFRDKTPSSDSKTPSRLPPQYWAPFVLSGDWR